MLKIEIIQNHHGDKLADAELHFIFGPLTGLKLVGFAIWQAEQSRHVTFPSRHFVSKGQRRSFALLRQVDEASSSNDRIRWMILDAYRTQVEMANNLPRHREPTGMTDKNP